MIIVYYYGHFCIICVCVCVHQLFCPYYHFLSVNAIHVILAFVVKTMMGMIDFNSHIKSNQNSQEKERRKKKKVRIKVLHNLGNWGMHYALCTCQQMDCTFVYFLLN